MEQSNKQSSQQKKPEQKTEKQRIHEAKKAEKRRIREARKAERLKQKRLRIERRLQRPVYQRLLFTFLRWLCVLAFVLFLFFMSVIAGLMVGMGIVGDANPTDALDMDTWRHIYRLIFPDVDGS